MEPLSCHYLKPAPFGLAELAEKVVRCTTFHLESSPSAKNFGCALGRQTHVRRLQKSSIFAKLVTFFCSSRLCIWSAFPRKRRSRSMFAGRHRVSTSFHMLAERTASCWLPFSALLLPRRTQQLSKSALPDRSSSASAMQSIVEQLPRRLILSVHSFYFAAYVLRERY